MFTNLSYAQQFSATLLGYFGKNTNILMEVHGHTIKVRRANDSAVIARLYVAKYEGSESMWITGIDSNGDTLPSAYSHEAQYISWALMACPKFPQILGKRERNWSPIVNKEVEGAY